MSKRQFFGTDGIRGTVGQGNITPDFVMKLAHAVGRVLRRTESRPTVVIGKDTRISGYMLESALESGFNSAGVDVLLLGPLPTPGVAYLTRAFRADLGVVISASHNPFEDNGIKFFSAKGTKLSDAWELEVEAAVAEPPMWAASHELGKTKRVDDAAGRYIEFAKSTFSHDLSLKGLRIVVDGANGAGYNIAPQVFHELGADVVAIGCTPDGLNINDQVGATHPEALVAKVREVRADYGVALDGDADRLQMVDASGRLFNGDEVLYLMVIERLEHGEKVPGAVGTLMSNFGRGKRFEGQGRGICASQSGRPLRAGGVGKTRLAAGWRKFWPPVGAGQALHGRRAGECLASVASLRTQWQKPRGIVGGCHALPASAHQRAAQARHRLAVIIPTGGGQGCR